MDEQVSMFDAFEALSVGGVPKEPEGPLKKFVLLDRVQVKKDGDDPLVLFQERLRRFFGKESNLKDGMLWIQWAGHWTVCCAHPSALDSERKRGIWYIYRAVYEALT